MSVFFTSEGCVHTILHRGGILRLIEWVIIFSSNGKCQNLIKSLQRQFSPSFLSYLFQESKSQGLLCLLLLISVKLTKAFDVESATTPVFVSLLVALRVFCVFVCFMLVQHCCDSEGNIMGLKRLQATAYNCLSVPYGNSASGTDMQSFSTSNPANLINEFPF